MIVVTMIVVTMIVVTTIVVTMIVLMVIMIIGKVRCISASVQLSLGSLSWQAGFNFNCLVQSLQKEKVDPLLREYEETKKLGQGLVRSAATNVRTTDLESGLDRLDSTWTALNEKVRSASAVAGSLNGLMSCCLHYCAV